MADRLTLNQEVEGSRPSSPANSRGNKKASFIRFPIEEYYPFNDKFGEYRSHHVFERQWWKEIINEATSQYVAHPQGPPFMSIKHLNAFLAPLGGKVSRTYNNPTIAPWLFRFVKFYENEALTAFILENT